MADSVDKITNATPIKITGSDEQDFADVTFQNGKWRLNTTGLVQIEEIFGQDPFPDSFFTINTAGGIGDTIRIQLAATTIDTTSPDSNAPAFDETYTLVAADVGNELKLRDNLITYMNARPGTALAFIKFKKAKDIRVIHVTSTKRSLPGEFYERSTDGDFGTTTTGTTSTTDGYITFESRGKSTSLARDPDSPHRLGILGISGSVTVTPGALTDRFFLPVLNGGSDNLRVNGSVTPVNFRIESDATKSLFIQELRFIAVANGIKYDQFLNLNMRLTNGVLTTIQSSESVFNFLPINSTEDFLATFSEPPQSFRFEKQAGADVMIGSFQLDNPFEIQKTGTFAIDDYIQVTIQDNLTSTNLKTFKFYALGFKKEV